MELGTTSLTDLLLDIDESVGIEFGVLNPIPYATLVDGVAFMARGLTERPATVDVDIIECDPRIAGVIDHYSPTVNMRSKTYEFELPYNYPDRLQRLEIESSCMVFQTPSLEDLVVMKLYAGRRHDLVDIASPAVLSRLNWDLLEHLIYDHDEALGSAPPERQYRYMLDGYERFATCHGHAQNVR